MRNNNSYFTAAIALAMLASLITSAAQAKEKPTFVTIFDGKTLEGWSGDPKFWSIEDGAITGKTSPENPTKGNTFCIWTGGEPGDFVLKLQFRIEAHNSGVQYRSFRLEDAADEWRLGGYQADFDAAKKWAGTNYGEKFRGILAKRGENAVITGTEKKGKKTIAIREVSALDNAEELAAAIKDYPKWNHYRIVAKGYVFKQFINGKLMSQVKDMDKENRRKNGLIGLQLHAGDPMKVQFKDIQLLSTDKK